MKKINLIIILLSVIILVIVAYNIKINSGILVCTNTYFEDNVSFKTVSTYYEYKPLRHLTTGATGIVAKNYTYVTHTNSYNTSIGSRAMSSVIDKTIKLVSTFKIYLKVLF